MPSAWRSWVRGSPKSCSAPGDASRRGSRSGCARDRSRGEAIAALARARPAEAFPASEPYDRYPGIDREATDVATSRCRQSDRTSRGGRNGGSDRADRGRRTLRNGYCSSPGAAPRQVQNRASSRSSSPTKAASSARRSELGRSSSHPSMARLRMESKTSSAARGGFMACFHASTSSRTARS